MSPRFAAPDASAIPLHIVDADDLQGLPEQAQTWANSTGFTGALGSVLVVPDATGAVAMALVGSGTATSRSRTRFGTSVAARKLPEGIYRIETQHPDADFEEFALGWLLESYDFDRYRTAKRAPAQLCAPSCVDAARLEAIAAGETLTRDLINTPANDMGPDELEAAARTLSDQMGAEITVISGDDLIRQGYPLIHAVGRASPRAPRLIDMRWGKSGPTLTLVGKGVCFDTGGLNLKPGASMGLMKKDMGGAATVLGLAQMIMTLKLPVQLRVLIPAVENAVSGTAFRPQDVLTSRKGLSVEINNTDAEGRLVLADALALADEDDPDLVISMATLTGAARVAVGPDLAPYFTDTAAYAVALETSAVKVRDPVWRLPFHDPYEAMIEPDVADLDNAPSGGMAGSITAALFLRRFVAAPYVHFDIYGWCPAAKPARPKGGVGMGARAILDALPKLLGI